MYKFNEQIFETFEEAEAGVVAYFAGKGKEFTSSTVNPDGISTYRVENQSVEDDNEIVEILKLVE